MKNRYPKLVYYNLLKLIKFICFDNVGKFI